MAVYKLIRNSDGEINSVTKDLGTVGTSKYSLDIPLVDDNIDYQEYLEWVNKGNKAEEPSVEDDWEQVRSKRDGLLAGSDWTMTTGATIDQAQWSAYREKLRDIPQTYKNVSHPLTEVVWPTTPSSKGPNS